MKELERRYIEFPVKTELRADSENNEKEFIEGIAAKVNARTLIGSRQFGFYEKIAPGAFDEILQDDIRCLFNHDSNLILSRTKSKTLEVFVNEDGDLAYRSVIPNRTFAQDLKDALEAGDVDGSSFAFTVAESNWRWADENDDIDLDERTITKFGRILDVSPVTYPAYDTTSSNVSARSVELWEEERKAHKKENSKINTEFRNAQNRYKYNLNKAK